MTEQRKPVTRNGELVVIAILVALTVGGGLWLFWPRETPAGAIVEDVVRPSLAELINADAVTLDISNVKCEQLVDAAIWGSDGITVTWRDGLAGCEMVEGLDILVGGEVFQLWRCSLLGGIQFDWRNSQRDDCADREAAVNPIPTPARDFISDSGCWIDHNTGFVICSGESSTPTSTPALVPIDGPLTDEFISDADTNITITDTTYLDYDEGDCYSIWGREICMEAERYYQQHLDMVWGRDTPTPTPAPTLAPEVSPILDLDYTEDDWGWLELTSQYSLLPEPDDVLFINWLSSILITDAFSVTHLIAGPATVRFSEEE